jgi:hypothetical protein
MYEKVEYTYDAQNRALTAIRYNYDDGQWIKNEVFERAYDSYGNLNLYIENQGWNNDAWRYQSRKEFVYNSEGRLTSDIHVYIYDEYGYKDEYTYGDILVNLGGDENVYNPLTFKESRWEDGAWVVEMEAEYRWSFDAANNPLSVELWEKDGADWTWYGTMTWYYSQHEVTGIKTLSSDRSRVWISGNELKIENAGGGEKVQMFDISGKLMVSGQLSNDNSIRRPSLPAGVYFVKAGNQTAKLIKQ